jgi:hypothetical protein
LNSRAYLTEKFRQAVSDLATGEGVAKARVEVAYHRFWLIPIKDYPEELRADRREIDELLTRLGGRPGYILPDNLIRMRNSTASKVASLILGIHFRLAQGEEA